MMLSVANSARRGEMEGAVEILGRNEGRGHIRGNLRSKEMRNPK
jgi:hypothetical protein